MLEDAKKRRLQDMANQVKAIDSAKAAYKAATIADNAEAKASQRSNVTRLQRLLLATIDSPVSGDTLSFSVLRNRRALTLRARLGDAP